MKYNQIINNLNLLIDSGIREFLEDSPQKYYNAKNEKNLYKDNLNKIKDLSELEIAIKNFNGCNLKNSAKNTVFADGNPNAKVMFIGEAPGKDEDIKGIPFVGLAGQLLDKMLFSIKLDRSKVYITNIIPWRPPGNRQPTTQEMLLCVPFIQKHIELVRPKILVLLGGTATKALLLLDEGIMKSRGKWHKYSSYGLANPILTRAIFHPAFLLRSPSYKKLAWEDLKEIEKISGSKIYFRGQQVPQTPNFKIYNDIPMSTTWVFVGLLAGRELAVYRSFNKGKKVKKIFPLLVGDFLKIMLGLALSVAVVSGVIYFDSM